MYTQVKNYESAMGESVANTQMQQLWNIVEGNGNLKEDWLAGARLNAYTAINTYTTTLNTSYVYTLLQQNITTGGGLIIGMVLLGLTSYSASGTRLIADIDGTELTPNAYCAGTGAYSCSLFFANTVSAGTHTINIKGAATTGLPVVYTGQCKLILLAPSKKF